ncbi:anion permease [Sutcliffiella horikoshii]|uniref:Probable membrane transporter protein n=1 Tax=Sutcliffiella horikoshii TaxID=79883 RepID=A0A1Y0CJV4_9BACI|nr:MULTISPECIES: sulfite exporter TauE/SafE family protein [Bacillaceae]ART75578.1 anion permease [Sutcliffiella horikoshii]TYS73892.1 sulfite exporter TauE/SafE family protein [Sutcliffiella horikoshii]
MEFLLFILLGFSISMLSGFFGIGGGLVLTPVLLLIGYTPIEAISTSLLYTIGTSMAGVYAHFKMKNIQWKAAVIIGASGVVATQIAYPVVSWLESNGYDTTVVPILYLALLTYFAYKMLKKDKGDNRVDYDATSNKQSFWKFIFIGFIAGFLSTTLGVGGGFIIVPLLIAYYGFSSKQAVATSLAGVILIVSAGFITYAVNNPINFKVGLFLIAGAIFGSQLGAKATSFFKSRSIQKLLGFLYIVTMLSLILEMIELSTVGLVAIGCYTIFINIFLLMRLLKKKAQPSH